MKKIFFGLLNKEKGVSKKQVIRTLSNEKDNFGDYCIMDTGEVKRYQYHKNLDFLFPEGRATDEDLDGVVEKMHLAISISRNEALDSVLEDFKAGYLNLSYKDRNKLLLGLAKEYSVDHIQLQNLIDQYLRVLEICPSNETESHDDLDALYCIEQNLKYDLRPDHDIVFQRLHKSCGGLEFLCTLQVDILSMLARENVPPLRALELQLKDNIRGYWLSCGSIWRMET